MNEVEKTTRSKDYEAILADPKKLAKQVAENMKQIQLLEKARARLLGIEVSEEAKIEKTPAGAVWDEQEKNQITSEIRGFDPKLADQIIGEKNKKKIVKSIDKRIKQVKKENKRFEGNLKELKRRQLEIMAKGGELVENILKEMVEIKGLYGAEAKILRENERIRDEVKGHIENKTVGVENIDHFVSLAKKLEENNKKDAELRKKIIEHRKKLEELKKKATPIEEEFVAETEEIKMRRFRRAA